MVNLAPPPAGTSMALRSALSGYNTSLSDYNTLAGKQASDLNDPNIRGSAAYEGNIINGAYDTAMDRTGLKGFQDAANVIRGQLTGAQNASAAVPTQTIAAARGSFANGDQVNTQANTSNIPYAEQVSQLSANLVPAENAERTAATNTANIAGQIVSGAQLEAAGFNLGQQKQLAALEAKIQQGAALTSAEYSTYAALQAAQIQAGATISAANIGASANKYLGALNNPGISTKFDANGNPIGQSWLNTTTPMVSNSSGSPTIQGTGSNYFDPNFQIPVTSGNNSGTVTVRR